MKNNNSTINKDYPTLSKHFPISLNLLFKEFLISNDAAIAKACFFINLFNDLISRSKDDIKIKHLSNGVLDLQQFIKAVGALNQRVLATN